MPQPIQLPCGFSLVEVYEFEFSLSGAWIRISGRRHRCFFLLLKVDNLMPLHR